MEFTYSYQKTFLKEIRPDEFVSRGAGFQSAYFVFEFETIILYTRRLVFYLVKLGKMGIRNQKFEQDYIDILPTGLLNVEYNQKQFIDFATILYDDMIQAREMYVSVCKKNNLEIEPFKPELKDPRKLDFLTLVKEGQKYFFKKYKTFNLDEMNFIELHLTAFKSITIHFTELRILGVHNEMVYNYSSAYFSAKLEKLRGKALYEINKVLFQLNNDELQQLYEVKKEKYGEFEATEISTSRRPGKAILVSGSNLRELELILEATKDRGIDVYTHGNMLLAHAYPKFKTYQNLVGHFSEGKESYLVDFLNFPGSILLTRYSYINVEDFYHGRLYTTDVMSTPNVSLIKNNNFEPLIESALRAEGFDEKIEKPPIKFNFSEKWFFNKITEIAEKIENGEIKHIFVIGIPANKMQQEYFDKLVSLLGNDCFAISFSYFNQTANILNIDLDYIFTFLCKALQILTRKISIEQLNPILLFTSCGINVFSNVVYMKMIGISKIYLADCPTTLVNPAFMAFIRKTYDIKNYTTPENDLKDMLI